MKRPDRTCVFPFGTKKRQTGKNRHLPDPSGGRPPPGLFFRIFCHAAVPKCPGIFLSARTLARKKQERRCMNMVICRTACILWQTAMSFPWHSQTKRRSGTTKEQKTGLPVTPELPARVLSGFSDHDAAVIRRPVQDPIEHLFPKKK